MNGFESIRAGATNGIEHVDMHPVLAERLPATADSPRRALLDEAGSADIYLLLLGPRYGEPGSGGKSPTEEEYEEAVRKGRPVLVLVQEGELEPEQATFLERIRGNWDSGVLGGFNWSSQHPSTEVCDGQAGWVDDRVDGQGADEVAGQAVAAARRRAAVLA